MTNPREIDAEIAEKVMGWVWNKATDSTFEWLALPSDHARGYYGARKREGKFDYFSEMTLPKYSTDMSAAFDVVGRLFDNGKHISLVNSDCEWFAVIPDDIQHDCVRGTDYPTITLIGKEGERYKGHKSPAMAICLAALKSIEGE